MADAGADDRDRQAFGELQARMIQGVQAHKKAANVIKMKEREKKRCQLTLQEIEGLPNDVRAFKSVGKAFILSTKNKIQTDLEVSVEEFTKGVAEAEKEREYLQKSVQDVEENMKELLRSSPGLTSSIAGMIR